MQLDKVRRMASGILKVGKNRVWMNPEEGEKIRESMTKEDVRERIKEGLIKKTRKDGLSRARARVLQKKKKLGRKKGAGKRKGSLKARLRKKESWIKGVRAQRKTLRELRKKGLREGVSYGEVYRMIKGNYFRGKKYLEGFVKGGKK